MPVSGTGKLALICHISTTHSNCFRGLRMFARKWPAARSGMSDSAPTSAVIWRSIDFKRVFQIDAGSLLRKQKSEYVLPARLSEAQPL